MAAKTKTNRKPAKRGRRKDEGGRMKDEGGRMKAAGEGAVPQAIDFQTFSKDIALLEALIDWSSDVKYPAGTDLAVYVSNQGDDRDRAALLLAVLPIARRVFDRNRAAARA